MEANKIRVSINGVMKEKVVSVFFDTQSIKIEHATEIAIPSDLVIINQEYDKIQNNGVCVPVGPENSKYIISDFKYDSQIMLDEFRRTVPSKDNEKLGLLIENLKEKYSIIDNQSFVNYLNVIFRDQKSTKLSIEIELVLDFLRETYGIKPEESFSFKDKIKQDYNIIKDIKDVIKFISGNSIDKSQSIKYKNTDIGVLQTNIDLFLELNNTDMSELFNNLKISNELPFAVYNSFFKIMKSFEVPEEWVEVRSDNSLFFYLLNTSYAPQKVKIENYTCIIITEVPSDDKSDIVSGRTRFKINIVSRLNDGVNEGELIQRILKYLPSKPINCSYIQNEIIAEYFLNIGKDEFYEQMFSDFIMLGGIGEIGNIISDILISDESDIIMRQKGGLFTYFRPNKYSNFEDFISININQLKVKPYEHKLFPNILKIDDNALHIKLKGIPNLQKATSVQKILHFILIDYLKGQQSKIISKYENYIEDIQEKLDSQKTTKDIEPKGFLKYQAPDIFTGKYASKCSGREPVLISEREALNSEGDILKFPLFNEGELRYFRCDNPSYPYVGLLPNDSLDAKYPYYPCCFGTNQKNDPKSLRYKYENNITEEEKDTKKPKKSKRVEIFTSPQIMEDGVIAILNLKIKNTLELLNTANYEKIKSINPGYLRMGCIKSPDSVLDAIIKSILDYNFHNKDSPNRSLDAFKIPVNYNNLDKGKRLEIIKQTRQELGKFIRTNMTSQSTYSYELEALLLYLGDDNNYLDIKMFWNIFEHAFGIKLFLFQKHIDENNSSLITPIYTQNYLRRTNNNDLVVVLQEHLGLKNMSLHYPQIENIVFNEFTDDIDYSPKLWLSRSYGSDKTLIDNLSELMNDILNYNGSVNRPIDIGFKNTIKSQWADLYGKIRLLQFDNLCLLCDPIPPFESPQINSIMRCDYKPNSLKSAMEFLQSEDIENYKFNIIENTVIGLLCTKPVKYGCKQYKTKNEGIRFYIPIIPTSRKNISDAETTNEIISPSFIGKSSIIESYNRFIKISNYLKEYALWIFSNWVSGKGIDMLNSSSEKITNLLYNFAEEGFKIDPNIEYPQYIKREFSINVENMIYNNKIIVQNKQIRDRLMYNLNLELSKNSKNVLQYYKRKLIKNFFIDATDFHQDGSYIIIKGLQMLKAYMTSNIPPNFVINSRVIPGTDLYFLQLNNNLRVKYLAQPAKTAEHALYICSVWADEKYNPGYYSTGALQGVQHTLYAYNDFNNYSDFTDPEEIEISGKKTSSELSVLMYRYNEEIYYVALLPFIEC